MANDLLYDDQSLVPGQPQLPSDDELAAAVDRSLGRANTQLRVVVGNAGAKSPDQAAGTREIADHFGLPASIVEGDYDRFKERYDADKALETTRQAPGVQDWLRSGNNAGIAKDDLENLSTLDQVLHAGRRMLGVIPAGFESFAQGIYGAGGAAARLVDTLSRPGLRVTGQILPGNIDLYQQPAVLNADGSTSTVDSFSVNIDGREVLLPTVMPDGRHLSQDDAVAEYRKTGRMLGVFDTPEHATQYADMLHREYASGKYAQLPLPGRVADFLEGAAVQAHQLAEAARGAQEGEGLVARAVYGGLEGSAAMVPALLVGAVTGGAGFAATFGAQAFGQGYTEAKAEGLSNGRALGYGALEGVIQTGLTYIPAHKLFADLAEGAPLLKVLLHQAKTGVPVMQVQTELSAFNAWMNLPSNKNKTAADYLREFPSRQASAVITALVTVAAVGIPAHATAHMLRQASDLAKESKTIERSPAAAADLIASVTKDTPIETVYLPIESFRQYWQERGVDPAQVAEKLTGRADAFNDATVTGQDLAVPMAQYLTQIAPTEHGDFFANETKVSPEQLNIRETKIVQEQLAEAAKAATEAPAAGSTEAIREDVQQRLEDAGVTPQAAAAYAGIWQSTFGSLGERTTMTPQEIYNRLGLEVGYKPLGEEVSGATEEGQQPSGDLVEHPRTGAQQDQGGAEANARAERGNRDEGSGQEPQAVALAQSDEQRLQQKFVETRHTLDLAPAEFRNGNLIVSGRVPSGAKAVEHADTLEARLHALEEPEARDAKNRYAEVALEQPLVTDKERRALRDADAGKVLDKFTSRVADNLRWLWNQMSEKDRSRARQWYVGAGRIARSLADASGYTKDQVSGVLAALSPQKDWFQNVSLARRVVALVPELERTDPVFDKKRFDAYEARTKKAIGGSTRSSKADILADIADAKAEYLGKKWSQMDTRGKAILLREFDEAQNPREYPIITPEGGEAGFVKTKKGNAARLGWGSYDQIGNAIAILRDGSPANINERLGIEHKVRSFFNNISDPTDARFVTIDTHAVAAALLQPLSGDSKVVKDTLGGRPNAVNVGLSGFNAAIAEGYFKLAQQLSMETGRTVLPREVQSVTWEAVRLLFGAEQKRGPQGAQLQADTLKLWSQFQRGKLTANALRTRIRKLAGGIGRPAWADQPAGVAPVEGGVPARDVLAGAGTVPAGRGDRGRGAGQLAGRSPEDAGSGVPTIERVRSPERRTGPVSRLLQRLTQPLFHGSPHEFERFSLEHVGTGEGAQAFGWGLYFAENPKVAETYRESTSPPEVLLDGRPLPPPKDKYSMRPVRNTRGDSARSAADVGQTFPDLTNEQADALSFVARDTSVDDTIANLRYNAELRKRQGSTPAVVELWNKRADILEELKPRIEIKPTGALYQVDVPDQHIANMIDGDVPLRRQPDAVKTAVRAMLVDEGFLKASDKGPRQLGAAWHAWRLERGGMSSGDNGVSIYELATRRFQGDEKAASQWLASQGVPGMRYFDQQSRAGGRNQTRNLVVYDDSIVKLTHKNGEPFTPAERQRYFQEEPYQPPKGARYESDFARGAISIKKSGQISIDLFHNANLSTFLHESGHVFLDLLQELAPRSEQLTNDLAILHRDLFKTEVGTKIETHEHELFARGFEAYLREGQAPSAELRGVFARVRAWLVGIYRSIAELNVHLTPEVRGVFDRLLATDDAIRAAEQESKVAPLFTDAKSAGMTPEQFDAYRGLVEKASEQARDELTQRIAKQEAREQKGFYKSERTRIRGEVQKELTESPVYRARAALLRGTHPDGTPLVGDTPTPIKDRAVVAEMFGFSSEDELNTALKNAAPLPRAIADETTRRMKEQYGDPMAPAELRKRALDAVNGEHRQAVIQAELKALTKGIQQVEIPPASQLQHLAQQTVSRTKVRDLKPGAFLMAAQRASDKAFDLKESDRVGAVRAKQQQLLDLALYREARDQRDFADKAQQFLGPYLDSPKARQRIGKAGGDYLEQLDALRERFDFAKTSLKELDRRASLKEFIEAETAKGHELAIAPDVAREAFRKNYKDLTVEELQYVYDAARSIEHWARFKDRMMRAQETRELSQLAALGAQSIAENSKGPLQQPVEPRAPGEKRKRGIRNWLIAHRPMQSIARQLDGFKDGFMFDHVWRPTHEARTAENKLGREAQVAYRALDEARFRGREREKLELVAIPELGKSLSLSARLKVALDYGNAGNRERMTAAGIGATGALTEAQQRAIIDTLKPEDWTYVRGVAKLISSYREQIGAMYKRVTGVEPKWVEPQPFQTKYGQEAGWYFPISYEGLVSPHAEAGPESGFADIIAKSSYMRFTTSHGYAEARQLHTGLPLRADLGVIGEHLQQIIHDLTHREMLIDVGRLFAKRDFQNAITQHYGAQYVRELQGIFRDIAVGPTPAPDWYRIIEPVRRMASRARLAFNFVTMTRHITNLTSGMARVGHLEVLKAIPRVLGSAKDAVDSAAWITANSELMRTRWEHRDESLMRISNDIGQDRGKWAAGMRDTFVKMHLPPDLAQRVADSYLYGMHKIIQAAEIPTWVAAYHKALEIGPTDLSQDAAHARAVASADNAIVDAFGGGDVMDQPGVQRSAQGKLLTTFMTYALSLHRGNYEILHRDRSVARKVVDATVLNIIPIVLVGSILHALQGKDESLVSELAKDTFAHMLGMFTFAREVAGAVKHRDYAGPASFAVFGTLSRLIYDSVQDVEKADAKGFGRAAQNVAEFGGSVAGVPVYQLEKTMQGLIALWEGKPGVGPAAALFGPPKKTKGR